MKGKWAHLRRWWHVHAVVLAAVGVLVAFLVGAFAGPRIKTVFGTSLNAEGQRIYARISRAGVEQGGRGEALPPAQAAKVKAAADAAEEQLSRYPHPLATPQPQFRVEHLARNYSSRGGARPLLLVVHDTESPNAPGTADVEAIRAWFNNPASQASSNFTTDATGNTLEMVPVTEKAWTQAAFNSWSISDELVGYASQRSWPTEQLDAVARIFARYAAKYGIPVRKGAVSGCNIVRSGIVEHLDLGACGGGHHDAGPAFPIARFIGLVRMYASAALSPQAKLRALTGYYAWLEWTLGEARFGGRKPCDPKVRPSVPRRIPSAWWHRRSVFLKARAAAKAEKRAVSASRLRKRTGYYAWLGWYLGEGDWRPYGRRARRARPNVPKVVSRSWWRRERVHVAAERA